MPVHSCRNVRRLRVAARNRHLHDDVAVVGGFGLEAFDVVAQRGDHQLLHGCDMIVGRVGDEAFVSRLSDTHTTHARWQAQQVALKIIYFAA